jgi:glyoxylase-like metal-dependent hydrolase (beta-lactamase superfamily II)
LRLGAAELFRVEDYLGFGLPPATMFAAFRPEMWHDEREWLVPRFFSPDGSLLRTSFHSWVVRTDHHTILIDSCIGNQKVRPVVPYFHMRNEPWIERLEAAGTRPEDVDFVMCTHLHADHVGWNTRLQDGRWVPTFPNARYLFNRKEFERWNSRLPDYSPRPINQFVFEDSISPVAEAGQMLLIDDGHTIDGMFTVEVAPGHTPGHAIIRLASDGKNGIFSGDVIHHPLQVFYTELRSVFDEDPEMAAATRSTLLAECVDRDIILFPSHFAEPHYCRVVSGRRGLSLNWD